MSGSSLDRRTTGKRCGNRLCSMSRGDARLKNCSLRTEQACVAWVRRFFLFHGRHHPREMGATEVEQFLFDMAVRGRVAAGTQNQELSAPYPHAVSSQFSSGASGSDSAHCSSQGSASTSSMPTLWPGGKYGA